MKSRRFSSVWHRERKPATAFSAIAFACLTLQSSAYAADLITQQSAVNPPTLESLQTSETAPQASASAPASGVLLGMPRKRTILLAPSTEIESEPHPGREQKLDLDIQYTRNKLWDPGYKNKDGTYGRYVAVYLRSYTGPQSNPETPFVAPTIETAPGDTVRITLHNKLPANDPSCGNDIHSPDVPHCFNNTNLHAHGLWVSPSGNSDNVMLTIYPNVSFQYEYNIPEDHPAGTFWYHPHQHGSTALQVSSGMAGALIVRGNRKPTQTANGDLDTLLVDQNHRRMPEQVIMLQQIAYACVSNPQHPHLKYLIDPKTQKPVFKNDSYQFDWNCDPGQTGVIESYDLFGPTDWAQSGRYTSINGIVQPWFGTATGAPIKAGEVQRWRLIHGGIRDTIKLSFRKLDESNKTFKAALNGTASLASSKITEGACTGKDVPYEVVASDGLTMAHGQTREAITLQPGYRNDILVAFPEPGTYCMMDESVSAAANVSRVTTSPSVLGFVKVAPGQSVPYEDLSTHIQKTVIADAQANMPDDIKANIVADLQDHFGLQKFVPHATITQNEVTGTQDLVFNIDLSDPNKPTFEVGTNSEDLRPYDPLVMDRTLVLNSVDEWHLESHMVSHPFHIHVNPFQIVHIFNPDGEDVSAPDAKEDSNDPTDDQFRGMQGVWKDTLMIKSLITPTNHMSLKDGVYKFVVRTRYDRYIGQFVLHCHILDHEDQGMMQNVEIVLPNGKGGVTEGMAKDMAAMMKKSAAGSKANSGQSKGSNMDGMEGM